MLNRQKVVFRADGNNSIGMGHVIRCLAIAEMLNEQFDCHFAIVQPSPEIEQTILKTCPHIIMLSTASITDFIGELNGKEIVVLDGYNFTSDHQKAIKAAGCKLVSIDDLHELHFYSDVVINHALTANADEYDTEPYTKVLTGSEYVMLRGNFIAAASKTRHIQSFHTAFVCFGGADKEELCYRICERMPAFVTSIHILLGAAYVGDLNQFQVLAEKKGIFIKTLRNIDSDAVLIVMQQSDFAIVAASGVAYECAAAGLPIITGFSMDHQREFYSALCRQPNIIGVQSWQECDETTLSTALQKLIKEYQPGVKSLVDGKQKERYLHLFTELAA